MSSTLVRRFVSAGAVAALAASPMLAPTSADAAVLVCRASMSDATPSQYSNVTVRVKTAPYAAVRTVAHYKTTDTVKRRKANGKGRANVGYYISGSTPGFKVVVDVRVSKNGKVRNCRTSFTAHK